MATSQSASNKVSTSIEWMWNSNKDLVSKSALDEWHHYSDIESMIIDKAYTAGETLAMLDDYHIDLKHNVQISNNDPSEQQPVKRIVCEKNYIRLRENRFLPNPIAPGRPFGEQYGFISPFIKEVMKRLNLTQDQFPSKNKTVVPMILDKAALGIVEEGKKLGKKIEAEYIADWLRAKKNEGMQEVWTCCAHLYSLESFLYKTLNETMRTIGTPQHEQVWRSKVDTLGPYCLLLWENPFNSKIIRPKTILYRGAQLSDDVITSFKDECSKNLKVWHSFQAFTSCSRNRSVCEQFGNVLFIMETRVAFTIDLSKLSKYGQEEEELLYPGVSFTINRVKSGENNNKHLIYLTLQQRHTSKSIHYYSIFLLLHYISC